MSAAMKAEDIRAAMLKPPVLKTETVTLPRMGINITVMEMDAHRLEQYESMIYDIGDNGKVTAKTEHMNAKIAVMSIVDGNGQLVFTPEDIDAIGHTYGKDLKQISNTAARISGLYSGEVIEKNSEPDRGKDT